MTMKARNLLFSALLIVTLSAKVSAVDSTAQSQDQAYREYIETYRKSQADYQKDRQIRTIVSVVLVAGLIALIAFGAIPAVRRSRETLEISRQQQKTLEEIRDLLKKHDT